MLREHEYNFTDFVAYLESFCSDAALLYLQLCDAVIDFSETAGDK